MQHPNVTPDLFKTFVFGDAGSGKTCFIKRVVDELPDFSTYQPLDADFKIKLVTDPETNKTIQIRFSEHDESEAKKGSPFSGADGVVITLDVTSRESFDNLEQYCRIIEIYGSESMKVFIIGTKSDDSANRKVWTEEILDFVERRRQDKNWTDHDLKYIETSAKNNYSIDQAIHMICESLFETNEEIASTVQDTKTAVKSNNSTKKECVVT